MVCRPDGRAWFNGYIARSVIHFCTINLCLPTQSSLCRHATALVQEESCVTRQRTAVWDTVLKKTERKYLLVKWRVAIESF